VRTKVCRKDVDWPVGLVYDPRGLLGVTTARSRVAGVLHVSLPIHIRLSCSIHLLIMLRPSLAIKP
jgi:hypothetical protein